MGLMMVSSWFGELGVSYIIEWGIVSIHSCHNLIMGYSLNSLVFQNNDGDYRFL